MSGNKGKVWIDLTDMSFWSGHLTGTQRVVYEASKRFHEHDPRAAFFVYNDKKREFYEIQFHEVADVVEQEELAATQAGEREITASGLGKMKQVAIRSYQMLPYSVRIKIKKDHKTKAKKAYRYAMDVRGRALNKRNSVTRTAAKISEPLYFGPQDTVLLLGKPWDTMSFIDTLRNQQITSSFRVVHLIYDLTPTFLPQVFGKPLPENYTSYMFEACSISETLVAISESTKRDVQKFCDIALIPQKKVVTARLGDYITLPTSAVQPALKQFSYLEKIDYILCVGTVEIRKNHTLLYTAYKEAARRGIAVPHLVIAGGRGWYTGDVLYEFENDPQIRDNVTILHSTSDSELAWLYKNCRFTIYASVYEGWGLPIAEALSYGKLCVASDTSSMTEIAGDLLDYFSPYDSVACLDLIVKYLDDKILADKETEIKKKYVPIGWDRIYEDLRKVV